MNPNHLIAMANQIGAFYETMPDRPRATADLAAHLKRFWEPRMRHALLRHAEDGAGAGLTAFVREALQAHRDALAAAISEATSEAASAATSAAASRTGP